MILHIADDEKFLDHSITMFETVHTNKNVYLVNTDQPLLHVKSTHKNLFCFLYGTEDYHKILKGNFVFEAVIFHDLIHSYKWELAMSFSFKIHLHWFCYGSELYNIPYLRDKLYLTHTKLAVQSDSKTRIKNWLEEQSPLHYNLIYKTLKKDLTTFVKFKRAVERINSFSSPVEDEIIYVQKYLNPNIIYIPYHHVTLDYMVSHVQDQLCDGQHFLLGNSANPTNNHIETFNILEKINTDYNIYVPLSYPKNEAYINTVSEHGRDVFGENFIPLTSFMPMDEYSHILKNCGNVVMNFNRQQGIANIVLALYLGAKVYLNTQNISYGYFKKLGVQFYHINELKANCNLENSEDLALHNRVILEKLYAEDVVLEIAQNLVHRIVQ
jgi:dTDP-N-acetylfucosamine:lipid II N-acetylfucosaminyltransferase